MTQLEYGPVCECGTTRKAIRGFGNLNAKVMLVGIAPGKTEEIEGRPLVGPSGKLTDAILQAVGYSRDECYATNLICWRKDDPTWAEIECCQDRLQREIETVRPELIIALGTLACQRFTGRPISKARGAIVRPEQVIPQTLEPGINQHFWGQDLASRVGYCVLPTWHPAYVLRVSSVGNDVVRDFHKIPRFLSGELDPVRPEINLVTDVEYAKNVWLGFAGHLVSVDVETEDDSEDSMARVISLAAATWWPNPYDPEGPKILKTWVFTREVLDEVFPYLKSLYNGTWFDQAVRWMFHNGQFDTQAIRRTFGVWLNIDEDTMLMSYNADERPGYDEDKNRKSQGATGPGNHGLKQLCRELLQAGWYDEAVKGTLGKSLEDMQMPQLVPVTEEELAKDTTALEGAESLDVRGPEGKELPKKKTSKKAEARLRYETEEEARIRYHAWLQDLYFYNSLDAAYTLALADRIPSDRDIENYYKILLPGANAYKEIQYDGIKVDTVRLRELTEEVAPLVEAGRKDLQRQAHDLGYRNPPKLKSTASFRDIYESAHGPGSWPLGVTDEDRKRATPEIVAAFELKHGPSSWPGYEPINLGSNLQVGNFLFKTLKLTPVMFTKKGGNPSTAADHMAKMDHPFCAAVAAHNQLEHVVGTYYVGAAAHIRPDERFHAYPWLHGTTTGRRAYTGPAMQTFPQDYAFNEFPQNRHLARIREVIVPSDPDMVLIEADYEQIEVWLGALLSGDQNMLADLQEPYEATTGDRSPNYHSRVARNILRCTDPDDSDNFKAVRQTAKTTTFSLMYLVEEDHFGSIIGRPKWEAKQIIRDWYGRYATYRQWQKKILKEMRDIGEITTPFGYRRRFPVVLDNSMDKVAVNHPIQSTGGTESLLSLIQLHARQREIDERTRVLLDVHDSLLVETPKSKVIETCSLIREVMCDPKIPGWPQLGISIKVGANWGTMVSESKWLVQNAMVAA